MHCFPSTCIALHTFITNKSRDFYRNSSLVFQEQSLGMSGILVNKKKVFWQKNQSLILFYNNFKLTLETNFKEQ